MSRFLPFFPGVCRLASYKKQSQGSQSGMLRKSHGTLSFIDTAAAGGQDAGALQDAMQGVCMRSHGYFCA